MTSPAHDGQDAGFSAATGPNAGDARNKREGGAEGGQSSRPSGASSPRPLSVHWATQIATSPWLWGGLLTFVFYQAIPHLPVWRQEATRYFCSHPIEYAEVGLFLIGLTIILFKTFQLSREKRVYTTVGGFEPVDRDEEPSIDACLSELSSRLDKVPPRDRNTYWFRRLDHLRGFLKSRRSDGLDEHLTFLSESAQGELIESHSLLQTIIWAIPILGFLGTVIGITLAIANITPEQLDSSLGSVTGGLSVAFDTTALGLTQSLILGFASLFIRRSEERLLGQMDERCRVEVHRALPIKTPSSPWLEAESQAARQLVARTESLVESHAHLWQRSIEEFRQRWTATLDQQREQLSRTLGSAAEATLVDHADQLLDFRREFVAAYRSVSENLSAELQRMEISRQAGEAHFVESLTRFGEAFQERMEAIWDRRDRALAERLDATLARIATWQEQMQQLNESTQQLLPAIHRQSETLLRIAGHEEELAGLQHRLTENLEAVRATESFEDAVHQLTGAIHLLTARTRPRDAA